MAENKKTVRIFLYNFNDTSNESKKLDLNSYKLKDVKVDDEIPKDLRCFYYVRENNEGKEFHDYLIDDSVREENIEKLCVFLEYQNFEEIHALYWHKKTKNDNLLKKLKDCFAISNEYVFDGNESDSIYDDLQQLINCIRNDFLKNG